MIYEFGIVGNAAETDVRQGIEKKIAARVRKYLFDEDRLVGLTALIGELGRELRRQNLSPEEATKEADAFERKLRDLIGKSGIKRNGATLENLTPTVLKPASTTPDIRSDNFEL